MTREELNELNENLRKLTAEDLDRTWNVLHKMWDALYMRSKADAENGRPFDEVNLDIMDALNNGAICAHAIQELIERCDK